MNTCRCHVKKTLDPGAPAMAEPVPNVVQKAVGLSALALRLRVSAWLYLSASRRHVSPNSGPTSSLAGFRRVGGALSVIDPLAAY